LVTFDLYVDLELFLDKKTARNLTTTGLRVVHFYMVAYILFGSITGMQVSMLTLTLDLKSIVDGIAKIYAPWRTALLMSILLLLLLLFYYL